MISNIKIQFQIVLSYYQQITLIPKYRQFHRTFSNVYTTKNQYITNFHSKKAVKLPVFGMEIRYLATICFNGYDYP